MIIIRFKNSARSLASGLKQDKGSLEEMELEFRLQRVQRYQYDKCINSAEEQGIGLFKPFFDNGEWRKMPEKELYFNQLLLKKCFGKYNYRGSHLGKRHIDKSIYVDQLLRWFENFNPKNFKIIIFEEWIKNPLQSYIDIVHFLEQNISFDSSKSRDVQGNYIYIASCCLL